MVNYPNYLSGSQDDINKRLLHMILEIKKSEGTDVTALASKISALETAVGKESGAGAGGILKDVKDVKDAIGTDETANTIKGRIYALEHPQTSGTE